MMNRILLTLSSLIIGSIALLAPVSRAVDKPVTDDAHFFSTETVDKANTDLAEIKTSLGKEMVVETFAGVPEDRKTDWEAAKDDKQKRSAFFATWLEARAHTLKVNGVYVLVVKDPSHLEVRAGADTRKKAFSVENQAHLAEVLLDAFKAKDFDAGLKKGIDYFRDTLKANLGSARATSAAGGDTFHGTRGGPVASSNPPPSSPNYPAPTNVPTNTPQTSSGASWMWIILLIIGAFIIVRVLSRVGSGGNSGSGFGQNYGNSGPGYGGGYNQGSSGGGGFFRNMLGGALGGAAGSFLYDKYGRRNDPNSPMQNQGGGYNPPPDAGSSGGDFGSSSPSSFSGDDQGQGFGGGGSGGDFGSSGGDSGGGGGGGDSGGGGSSGGDF